MKAQQTEKEFLELKKRRDARQSQLEGALNSRIKQYAQSKELAKSQSVSREANYDSDVQYMLSLTYLSQSLIKAWIKYLIKILFCSSRL